jgi:hypothetical protein
VGNYIVTCPADPGFREIWYPGSESGKKNAILECMIIQESEQEWPSPFGVVYRSKREDTSTPIF